jgi:exopolysaccharide production protein ExoQ
VVRLIAALLCALGIWQLFRLGREQGIRTSPALWIPTLWLFVGATRNLSEWLRLSAPSAQPTQYLEGNPFDQAFLATLLALGLIVLISRGQRVWKNLQSNIPVLLYFVYCAISIVWSDFPDVAFRRWFRASGDVLMVLIVLSDPNWITAVRRVFARVAFVAMPVSILFIRYFPEYGRAYSRGGLTAWCGVATGKNSLGIICMVFGLSTLSRFLEVYRDKQENRRTGQLVAYGVTTIMAMYLLYEAHSATSSATFAMACAPLVLTQLFRSARKPAFVHLMVIAILGLTVASLFFDASGGMVQQLGRDSTLTGRTDIWRSAFSVVQNPVVGTGFESFWVGPRLTRVEQLIGQGINQAHDGYIEVYLNLGWVGVALLAVLLISAYRRVIRALRMTAPLASLGLAYFVATAAYNCAEAGIKMMSPLWIALLLFAMATPEATSPNLPELDHGEDLTNSTSKTAEAMATIPAVLERRPKVEMRTRTGITFCQVGIHARPLRGAH